MKKSLPWLTAVLLLASPLVLTLPWQEWLQAGMGLRATMRAFGSWSAPLFVLATALATALGVPRLVFCVMGGWLFGFAWGFAWSQLGSLLGAYGLFVLARHTRPETLLVKYPRLRALSAPVGRGWFSVLVVRQLPLAGLYNDILLAWSPVSHRDFWIGSFIGFLPLGITASLMGAGAIQADLAVVGRYLAMGALLFVTFSLALKWLVQRRVTASPTEWV